MADIELIDCFDARWHDFGDDEWCEVEVARIQYEDPWPRAKIEDAFGPVREVAALYGVADQRA